MTGRNSDLSRKEMFTGSMIIFIALFYLLSIGSSVLSAGARFDRSDMKMLALALFYLFGGIFFFRKKNAGWIISTAILLHFVMVMLVFIISLSQTGTLNAYSGMSIFLFFLLLLGFLFLFGKQTRRKYMVNNKSYLLTIGIYLVLIFTNFYL